MSGAGDPPPGRAVYYATKIDMVGPAFGRRRLEDFFVDLAAQIEGEDLGDLVTGG